MIGSGKDMRSIFFTLLFAIGLTAQPPQPPLIQDGQIIPLWSGQAPGAQGTEDRDIPTITVYLPRTLRDVFLDGPPRLGDVTQSAAVAADVAVLPIQPGPFDFWAVAETLESLDQADQIREQLGPLQSGVSSS